MPTDKRATRDATPVILWFRQDLRLADNRALLAAIATGQPIIPVTIVEPATAPRAPGGASRWWQHRSLQSLAAMLEALGSRLIIRGGDAATCLPQLVKETGATSVFVTRVYEPLAAARDATLAHELEQNGTNLRRFGGNLLLEPEAIKTKTGDPYKVYTPFWRALLATGGPKLPLPAPTTLSSPKTWPRSDTLRDVLPLPSKPDWAGGLRDNWQPGETGAADRLQAFLANAALTYAEDRNRPDKLGTSRLSPHLHFGEISPATCWHAAIAYRERVGGVADVGIETFLKELVWREFSYNLLTHWPTLPEKNFRSDFDRFPWRKLDRDGRMLLQAWQKGQTGYPIVDAGMRELWHTGWMHNRVRMIVASFLIKHCLIDWREGEAWFWDTLVDADLASNAASWQWVAGSGADAAPYFRIFNPVTQGEKFDPDGAYIRQWVPELAKLPQAHLNAPWQAPQAILNSAAVSLGRSYPAPVVDHATAREMALAGFAKLKASA